VKQIGSEVATDSVTPAISELVDDWHETVEEYDERIKGGLDQLALEIRTYRGYVESFHNQLGKIRNQVREGQSGLTKALQEAAKTITREFSGFSSRVTQLDNNLRREWLNSLTEFNNRFTDILASSDVPVHLEQLASETSAMRETRTGISNAITELRAAVDTLKDELRAEVTSVEQRLPSTERELQQLQAIMSNITELLGDLNKSASGVDAATGRLDDRATEMSTTARSMEDAVNSFSEQLHTDLVEHTGNVLKRVDHLEKQAEGIQTQLERHSSTMTTLYEQLRKSMVRGFESARKEQKKAIDGLNDRVEANNDKLKEFDRQLRTLLEDARKEQRKAIDSLNLRVKAQNDKLEDLDRQLQAQLEAAIRKTRNPLIGLWAITLVGLAVILGRLWGIL